MLLPRRKFAVLAALAVLTLLTYLTFSHFHPHHDKPTPEDLTQHLNHPYLHLPATTLPLPRDRPAGGVSKNGKKIVYTCSGTCGGWADRQKGIVGAYVLASMLGRDFGIQMPVPCDLHRLLDVGKVDWRLRPEEMRGSRKTYKELDQAAVDFTKRFLASENLQERFPEKVSSFTWNMEVVQFLQKHRLASTISWLAGKPFPEVYKRALEDLFVLKPDLQKELDQLESSRPPGTKLVCAQVRLGKHNGSFPDSLTIHSFQEFPTLVRFLSRYNDSRRYRLFFSSDSLEILQRAKAKFPETFLQIQGPITHTDKSQGADACQGFQKAIVDEYALSRCDVLVISESGLGKIASFIRGTDSELFLFHRDHVDPFTRLGTFPNKEGW